MAAASRAAASGPASSVPGTAPSSEGLVPAGVPDSSPPVLTPTSASGSAFSGTGPRGALGPRSRTGSSEPSEVGTGTGTVDVGCAGTVAVDALLCAGDQGGGAGPWRAPARVAGRRAGRAAAPAGEGRGRPKPCRPPLTGVASADGRDGSAAARVCARRGGRRG